MAIQPYDGARVQYWSKDEKKYIIGSVLEKKKIPKGSYGGFVRHLYTVEFDNGEIKDIESGLLKYSNK